MAANMPSSGRRDLASRYAAEELRRVTAQRDELERQAIRDPLSGLLNRRGLLEQLETELERAKRGNYPVTLVAVDLDFFKQVNDLYGHAVGDEVLEAAAQRLCSETRPGDLCSRLGGDEFVLGLVNADTRLTAKILGRMDAAIASIEFGPGLDALSFSAGISEFPRHSTDLHELMTLADAALYRAKAGGRHRFHTASSEVDASFSPDLGSLERHRLNVQNSVEALARAVDARNGYTHRHSQAVAFYAVSLARVLGAETERIEMIRRAAVLHDVGKIGVPDRRLLRGFDRRRVRSGPAQGHRETTEYARCGDS